MMWAVLVLQAESEPNATCRAALFRSVSCCRSLSKVDLLMRMHSSSMLVGTDLPGLEAPALGAHQSVVSFGSASRAWCEQRRAEERPWYKCSYFVLTGYMDMRDGFLEVETRSTHATVTDSHEPEYSCGEQPLARACGLHLHHSLCIVISMSG